MKPQQLTLLAFLFIFSGLDAQELSVGLRGGAGGTYFWEKPSVWSFTPLTGGLANAFQVGGTIRLRHDSSALCLEGGVDYFHRKTGPSTYGNTYMDHLRPNLGGSLDIEMVDRFFIVVSGGGFMDLLLRHGSAEDLYFPGPAERSLGLYTNWGFRYEFSERIGLMIRHYYAALINNGRNFTFQERDYLASGRPGYKYKQRGYDRLLLEMTFLFSL